MTAPRLAWGLLGLWVALTVLASVLFLRTDEISEIVFGAALSPFAVVGAVVASRRPENPIGWILEGIALFSALGAVVFAYVASSDDPAPLGMWLDHWISDVWVGLVAVAIPLLYPDGRLPSARWRRIGWAAAGAFALGVAGRAFAPGLLDTEAPGKVENPYALPGLAGEIADALAAASGLVWALAVLGSFAALIARLRRARGIERQQLKWFTYVCVLMLCALLLAAVSLLDPERLGDNIGVAGWGGFLLLVTFGIPLSVGMAILRHRLYDIDVVINRTLVYGPLTATLGATYLGLVLLLGLTLGTSDLAIAISTLAVAALFRPARSRIQAAVDRRFYRRRYDAARTLEAFSTRLRDELDLDALRGEISTVVGETVQPAHVSLWLREGRR